MGTVIHSACCINYSLLPRTLARTMLVCWDQIARGHDKLFVDLLESTVNIMR